MSGLDGALLDEFTQGINAPANGQQGYVAFADLQAPQPNLEYKSPTQAAAALKQAIVQTVDVKSAEPATIAANGLHQISVSLQPQTPYAVFEFVMRAQVRVGTTMQWYARRRFTVTTDSSGFIASNHDVSEATIGSGFSLVASTPGPTAVLLSVSSTTGTPGTVFASITETYRKVTPTP
jgi:hypothetical protein